MLKTISIRRGGRTLLACVPARFPSSHGRVNAHGAGHRDALCNGEGGTMGEGKKWEEGVREQARRFNYFYRVAPARGRPREIKFSTTTTRNDTVLCTRD